MYSTCVFSKLCEFIQEALISSEKCILFLVVFRSLKGCLNLWGSCEMRVLRESCESLMRVFWESYVRHEAAQGRCHHLRCGHLPSVIRWSTKLNQDCPPRQLGGSWVQGHDIHRIRKWIWLRLRRFCKGEGSLKYQHRRTSLLIFLITKFFNVSLIFSWNTDELFTWYAFVGNGQRQCRYHI